MRAGGPLALSLLLVTGLSSVSGHASAQPEAGGESLEIAREQFERGERMFALGRFEDALEAYRAALAARHLPEFHFNIGQCYRNLGDYRSAVASYRRYLELAPDTSRRESVEATIEELEAELERSVPTRIDPLAAKPEPLPPGPGRRRDEGGGGSLLSHWGFWTGVAVLAAGVTAGAIYVARPGRPASDLGNLDFGK